jgi:hypothetical protein
MLAILKKNKKALGFILCAGWLSVTVAFFAMITSGGEANMELELGTFIELKGRSAVIFTRGIIGFGLLMLVLFIWRHRVGFVLGLIWSLWWGVILSTSLFNPSSFSDRLTIIVVIFLFIVSALFALTKLKVKREISCQCQKKS